jgi:hypothetical protein
MASRSVSTRCESSIGNCSGRSCLIYRYRRYLFMEVRSLQIPLSFNLHVTLKLQYSPWKVCTPPPNQINYSNIVLNPSIYPKADLHQIIKSGQTLTNEHVQYFTYQILRGTRHALGSLVSRHSYSTLFACAWYHRHEVCALRFGDPSGPQARKSARQLRL